MAQSRTTSIIYLDPSLLRLISLTTLSPLEKLPAEVLAKVFSHSTAISRIILPRTSKYMAQVSQGSNVLNFNINEVSQQDLDGLDRVISYKFELHEILPYRIDYFPDFTEKVHCTCILCNEKIRMPYCWDEQTVRGCRWFTWSVLGHMEYHLRRISELDIMNIEHIEILVIQALHLSKIKFERKKSQIAFLTLKYRKSND